VKAKTEQSAKQITPDEARAAVLAGRTVRVVVGADRGDPICLHYLDRCYENDYEPMIHTESIAGWSAGIKECVCEPDSTFYVGWLAGPTPLSITVADEHPPQRESRHPVAFDEGRR